MRVILVLGLCLISISTVAQFGLEGTVRDATTNLPLPGASLYLPDLKKGTIADHKGNFSIVNIPRGKFLIEIRSLGYASYVQLIDISEDVHMDFSLNSAIAELNEIVISGISRATELKRNPISVATLNEDALRRNTSTNIIDNIAQKAGVYQITTGVAVSKPVVRGLGYNRIITLYDGMRQEGQQWGDEHGIEIDEFAVDRVEIIKGAASLMYGSDGIGGVINFLTPNPVHEGSIQGEWISNYQTNNGLIANSLMNAGNLKGLYWNLRGSQKSARPYRNEFDGRVLNSGFNEKNVNAIAGLNKSWGYTQFSFNSFNQAVGLVEGERDMLGQFLLVTDVNGMEEARAASEAELRSYELYIPKQSINHLRVGNSTNFSIGATRTQWSLGFQRNQRREFGNVLDEAEEELHFDLRSLNYNVIAHFPEQSGWAFSAGVSGMVQENQNRGEEFLIPAYQLNDLGAVVFVKKNFDQLNFSGGVRVDGRSLSIESLFLNDEGRPTDAATGTLKFKEDELSFENVSATAGFAYQFDEAFSIKTNASRGFRAPNISELASNGRHEGSLRYEYGNYDLKAETSFQTDVAFLLNTDHISADLSLYRNAISNFIYAEKLLAQNGSDSIPDPDEPAPAFQYVQGRAVLTGAEFYLDLHPHPLDWLHFENSISLVYSENKSARGDSARYLPFTPAPRIQSELRASANKWKSFANLFVRVQLQHYARQNRVLLENGTESPTASYTLWNAGIGTEILRKGNKKAASVYFTVTNLFDTSYQDHLSRLKYADENPVTGRRGIFNVGRNFSVKLIVPMEFRSE